jgi:hypothetical protein
MILRSRDLYSDKIRTRAWRLILQQIATDQTSNLTRAALKWSRFDTEISLFLLDLILCMPPARTGITTQTAWHHDLSSFYIKNLQNSEDEGYMIFLEFVGCIVNCCDGALSIMEIYPSMEMKNLIALARPLATNPLKTSALHRLRNRRLNSGDKESPRKQRWHQRVFSRDLLQVGKFVGKRFRRDGQLSDSSFGSVTPDNCPLVPLFQQPKIYLVSIFLPNLNPMKL